MSKINEMFFYLNQFRDLPGYDEIWEEAKNECLAELENHTKIKCDFCAKFCGFEHCPYYEENLWQKKQL